MWTFFEKKTGFYVKNKLYNFLFIILQNVTNNISQDKNLMFLSV